MSIYPILKTIHISCATLSILLFILRGFWMLAESDTLQKKWVKIAPHLIDTTLLGSALSMLFYANLNPLEVDWLALKLILLVAYIITGLYAFRFARTFATKRFLWLTAIAIFAAIVLIAISKSTQPSDWLAVIT